MGPSDPNRRTRGMELVNGSILNIPSSCGLGVRSHGAEDGHKEIHQEPVAVSWQEWPGQEGGMGKEMVGGFGNSGGKIQRTSWARE